MPRLNYQQVAQLAWDAGWRGKNAQTAVAIARGESGFDTMNTNFKGLDHSYGLWQINMRNEMGPQRRQQFGLSSNEQLFDPATNARVAYGLWKDRGGFTDWTVYNDRTYTLYLNGAVFAVKQIEQGKKGTDIPSYDPSKIPAGQESFGSQKVIPDPTAAIKNVADAIKQIGNFINNKENWFRAVAIVGGIVLLILAVTLIASDTLISQALKRVGKAGKVAKAVT